jgi:hypothetical protein
VCRASPPRKKTPTLLAALAGAGVTYKYDGDGKRVSKSTRTLYWYGGDRDPLAETDVSGNPVDEYIFFGKPTSRLADAISALGLLVNGDSDDCSLVETVERCRIGEGMK